MKHSYYSVLNSYYCVLNSYYCVLNSYNCVFKGLGVRIVWSTATIVCYYSLITSKVCTTKFNMFNAHGIHILSPVNIRTCLCTLAGEWSRICHNLLNINYSINVYMYNIYVYVTYCTYLWSAKSICLYYYNIYKIYLNTIILILFPGSTLRTRHIRKQAVHAYTGDNTPWILYTVWYNPWLLVLLQPCHVTVDRCRRWRLCGSE